MQSSRNNNKVVLLNAVDDTGIKRNVAKILELERSDNIRAICIVWRSRDDKGVHFYQNGDDYELMGMLSQQIADISAENIGVTTRTYERGLGDDPDEPGDPDDKDKNNDKDK